MLPEQVPSEYAILLNEAFFLNLVINVQQVNYVLRCTGWKKTCLTKGQ